jgi:hypothetical protein
MFGTACCTVISITGMPMKGMTMQSCITGAGAAE